MEESERCVLVRVMMMLFRDKLLCHASMNEMIVSNR